MPFGMAEALVGIVERLDGQAEEAEIQPAPRHVVRSQMFGDRGIGFVDKALALCSIARRPFRRRPFQLRSGRSQSPSALPCAGAGTLKPRLGRRQPAGLDTEPAVPGGADDEQEVVELVVVPDVLNGVYHLLPQRD